MAFPTGTRDPNLVEGQHAPRARTEFSLRTDGVPVHGTGLKGTENQEVEGALQQLDPFNLFFSRHSR